MSFTETDSDIAGTVDTASETMSEQVFETVSDSESDVPQPLFEVDGTPITLDEARSGYLRQSDYTRKTQELAEQRRQLRNAEVLQSALQRDPQATLRALADAYGVTSDSHSPSSAATADGWGDDMGDEATVVADPRLDELVRWREQQEVAAAQATIQNELAQLHGVYGEFDDSEVLRFTLDNSFPDVTAAFKAWKFDDVQAELARRQEETRRVQGKRDAQVVTQGASRSGASSVQPAEGGMSIRDAWLAAKKELGG